MDDKNPRLPAVDSLYRVFSRPPSPVDVALRTRAAQEALASGDDDLAGIGKPLYASTRLVAGTARAGLYAFKTTKLGYVCVGMFPDGGGNCSAVGPYGLVIAQVGGSTTEPLLAYGLVGNAVRSIEVVRGATRPIARVRANGFLIPLHPASPSRLDAVYLHLADRRVEPVSLAIGR